jgi:hypothetical protein
VVLCVRVWCCVCHGGAGAPARVGCACGCVCMCVCVRVFAEASRAGSTRIRCREQTTRDQVSVLLEKLKHLPFEMKVDYEIAIEAK